MEDNEIKQEIECEVDISENSIELMYPKVEIEVSKDNDFICYVCGRIFGVKGDLSKHIKRIHEAIPGSHVCDICAKTFKNRSDLYHHNAQVHEFELLKCEKCSVDCKNERALRKHVARCSKREKPLPIHYCILCSQTFSLHKTLYAHLNQHHNNVELFCDVCDKNFELPSEMFKHRVQVHKLTSKINGLYQDSIIADPKIFKPVREETYTPHKSDDVIPSTTLKSENIAKLGGRDCGWENGSSIIKDPFPFNYFSHMNIANLENRVNDSTGPDYSSRLINHDDHEVVKTEHEYFKIKEEVSDNADATWIEKVPLKAKKVKTKSGCMCDTCARIFPTPSLLKKHMRTAHIKPEDSTACEICGKIFRAPHLVQHHVREVHSSVTFWCEICGKQFGSKVNLKRHVQRHTTEKLFPCNLCDLSFATPNYLKHHHTAVHDRQDTPCDVCGKMYKNKYLMRKHYKKYHENISTDPANSF